MRIGSCKVEVYIPNTTSLKDKRGVIKGLKKRIHNKFNVAISEIEKNDNHKISILVIVTVSNERRYVDKLLSSVVNFMEHQKEFEIENFSIEVF